MNSILVFYAGLLYGEYPFESKYEPFKRIRDTLPDGAYICLPEKSWGVQWYRSDFTPVLGNDVPKELLLLALLLT